MDRYRFRKRNSKSNARKRQQPKNTQNIRQTNKHAQRTTKRLSNNIPTKRRRHAQKLPKTTQTNRLQTPKPKINANQLPHTPPLQGHNGIPQDQRHPSRHANLRPQKHQQHPHLHTARKLQRRRLHRKSSPLRTRSLPTRRGRLRIRLRL